MKFFDQKKQKIFDVGKLRKYEEQSFFLRKKFSSFKFAILPDWEGAKYAGGSRLTCWYYSERPAIPQLC